MEISFFKRVDKSVLLYGLTFGVSGSPYVKLFEGKKKLKPGEYRDIKILWDDREYPARIGATKERAWKGKKYPIAYRILYGEGKSELKEKLAKTFISSYIKVVYENRKLTKKTANEILEVTPISADKVRFSPFLTEKTEFYGLFKDLIEKDVFGWLKHPKQRSIFLKTSKWFPKRELRQHQNEKFVIYFLMNTRSRPKELYIGKADILGARVKTRRQEIPNWNVFRYSVLKPEFSGFLERIEYYTILAFARIFKNKMKTPTLGLEDFIIVNKAKGLNP